MLHASRKNRIARTRELATKYPFAAELLTFYAEIARFQETLFERLEDAAEVSKNRSSENSLSGPPELAALISSFRPFLATVQKHGPARLVSDCRELQSAAEENYVRLLNAFWDTPQDDGISRSDSERFLARAFLQPYAEFVRLRADLKWNGYTGSVCPFCERKPGVSVLRPLGDGGQRCLICSFCMAEWEFRRILCAACGEEDHRKLPVYSSPEFEHIRVDCCDRCKGYMKTVDLTKTGIADPVVDEIASAPLDLWAREHGYTKLQANLLLL